MRRILSSSSTTAGSRVSAAHVQVQVQGQGQEHNQRGRRRRSCSRRRRPLGSTHTTSVHAVPSVCCTYSTVTAAAVGSARLVVMMMMMMILQLAVFCISTMITVRTVVTVEAFSSRTGDGHHHHSLYHFGHSCVSSSLSRSRTCASRSRSIQSISILAPLHITTTAAAATKITEPTDMRIVMGRASEISSVITKDLLWPVGSSIIKHNQRTKSPFTSWEDFWSESTTITTAKANKDAYPYAEADTTFKDKNNEDKDHDHSHSTTGTGTGGSMSVAMPILASNPSSVSTNTTTPIKSGTMSMTLTLTNAERLVWVLEQLGPTFVKFGQAAASREDLLPQPLTLALTKLHNEMDTSFDTTEARHILQEEWNITTTTTTNGGQESQLSTVTTANNNNHNTNNVRLLAHELLDHLSVQPVAAASVGQVYKSYCAEFGHVAIKVKRPSVEKLVEADAMLFVTLARLLEAIPALPRPMMMQIMMRMYNSNSTKDKQKKQQEYGGNNKNNESNSSTGRQTRTRTRLVATELVAAVQEFMSRLFEELDYRKEARNAQTFAALYGIPKTTTTTTTMSRLKRFRRKLKFQTTKVLLHPKAKKGMVIVPSIIPELCTDRVIVMEWIDGQKLTTTSTGTEDAVFDVGVDLMQENLMLLKEGIDCTLCQLFEHGVLHCDPHGGNLLKVKRRKETTSNNNNMNTKEEEDTTTSTSTTTRRKRSRFARKKNNDAKSTSSANNNNHSNSKSKHMLAYLDFGLVAEIPVQVRDGLVCAVSQLVFAKDVDAVAQLFGELQLLPAHVLQDQTERAALSQALETLVADTFEYDPAHAGDGNSNGDSDATTSNNRNHKNNNNVPTLKFDKLLENLAMLVPRFQFQLPPYFLNNARALGTLEGMARAIDPAFNVLGMIYPYALRRLLENPSNSPVVRETLQTLVQKSKPSSVSTLSSTSSSSTSSSPTTARRQQNNGTDWRKVKLLVTEIATLTNVSRRQVLRDILNTKYGRTFVRGLVWGDVTLYFDYVCAKITSNAMRMTMRTTRINKLPQQQRKHKQRRRSRSFLSL
jgi:predicted unusual protein kinase regulating ubiquinone biosynthesis (AarF/ABC1/UbiB family)